MAFPIRVGVKALIVKNDKLLLIKYKDRKSVHYNLPGGGIRRGESVRKALKREVYEETGLKVSVGQLLLVSEYDPIKHKKYYGRTHKLTLIFKCKIKNGSKPTKPPKPDRKQVDTVWSPLKKLPDTLYPSFTARSGRHCIRTLNTRFLQPGNSKGAKI